MAIKIEYDRICIGNFILCEDANGVAFDGKVCANQFIASGIGGTSAGYIAAGYCGPSGTTCSIDSYAFASSTSGALVGCTAAPAQYHRAVNSSPTNGYISSGDLNFDVHERFPFAASAPFTAVDIAEISTNLCKRASSYDKGVRGYLVGGYCQPPASFCNNVDQFPFANDTSITDAGDLVCGRRQGTGSMSATQGIIGGGLAPAITTSIEAFPFATSVTSSSVGSLSPGIKGASSNQSGDAAYFGGGYKIPPGCTSDIQKFSFSSGGTTSCVGNLTGAGQYHGGSTDTTHGYIHGGGAGISDTIERFPFAGEGSSADIGEITGGSRTNVGNNLQV
jgi:hypothetical protein